MWGNKLFMSAGDSQPAKRLAPVNIQPEFKDKGRI